MEADMEKTIASNANNIRGKRLLLLPVFSLFGSFGTLVCCALPALFVSIGAGATLAGIASAAPWLIALSKYKVWTFGISGSMIFIAGFFLWSAKDMACPIDPVKALACARLRVFSIWIYIASAVVWCIGFFFAFLAIHFFA